MGICGSHHFLCFVCVFVCLCVGVLCKGEPFVLDKILLARRANKRLFDTLCGKGGQGHQGRLRVKVGQRKGC